MSLYKSHSRPAGANWIDLVAPAVLANGQFLKFDPPGSAKALSMLTAMKKDTDLKATVTGTLKRDVITVETLDIQ